MSNPTHSDYNQQLINFILNVGKHVNIDVSPELKIASSLNKSTIRNNDWYHRLNILNYRILLICLSSSNVELAGQWTTLIKDF